MESSVTFTLAAQFERLTLTGAAAINGTGNGAGNILTGNSNNNTLNGAGGNDQLIGGIGADILSGGAGIDDFIYTLINQSTPGAAGRDNITGFTSGMTISISAQLARMQA